MRSTCSRHFIAFVLCVCAAASSVEGATRTELAKLVDPDPNAGANFGYSVAVSGDTLIVAAPFFYSAGLARGAAFVYVRVKGAWVFQQELASNIGVGFGGSVALSGDTAVIGHAPVAGVYPDSAHVFVRSNGVWTQQALLTVTDPAIPYPNVGTSVAVSGNTALVSGGDSGSVYVFVRAGTTWTRQAKLVSADLVPYTDDFGGFIGGRSVALAGDTAIVGADHAKVGANTEQGAAYVFVRSGNTWAQQAKLTASTGRANSRFGGVVALSGDTALIGPGKGYLFNRIGGTWTEQAPLEIPAAFLTCAFCDGAASPVSVGIDGDAAVLGVMGLQDIFRPTPGAVYTFKRSAGVWAFQDQLIASDGAGTRNYLGSDVSISGNTVVAGGTSAGYSTGGVAYVFAADIITGAPTISSLTAKSTAINTSITVNVTVDDADGGPSGVSVSASAANPALVPNAGLVFSGSGASRTLTITPALNVTGTTLITVTASDGTLSTNASFTIRVGPRPSEFDFDGDGKTEITVFRPTNGTWYVRYSSTGYSTTGAFQWGLPNDIAIAGDFDGDGQTELTVFRPSNGTWYLRYSSLGYSTTGTFQWGLPGDVPIARDFDGDGRSDVAVWRPSTGTWYIRYSSLGYGVASASAFQWGLPGDVPVASDFDGDGRADLAVWRPSTGTWFVRYSSFGFSLGAAGAAQWGLPGDLPIAGDFDGDGKTELAVWRPSTGTWYIRYSSLGYGVATAGAFQWGLPGDLPVTTDFDGDGKADLGVWRSSNGTWYVRYSSLGYGPGGPAAVQWGLPGDAMVR
jgi:hypothetical protein